MELNMLHCSLSLMMHKNMPRVIYIPALSLLLSDLGERLDSNALISQFENLGRRKKGSIGRWETPHLYYTYTLIANYPQLCTFCFMCFIRVRCGIPCGSGCFNSLETWREVRIKKKLKKKGHKNSMFWVFYFVIYLTEKWNTGYHQQSAFKWITITSMCKTFREV